MKAHPTVYAGCQFRSRLEAKWAAFFDLVGWRWEYEAQDEEGWTPDFILGDKWILRVEVKPAYFDTQTEDRREYLETHPELEKVRRWVSGARKAEEYRAALICGSVMPLSVEQPSILGGLLHSDYGDPYAGDTVYLVRNRDGFYDLTRDMYGPGHLTGAGYREIDEVPQQEFDRLWREAGNKTQWKGVQAVR